MPSQADMLAAKQAAAEQARFDQLRNNRRYMRETVRKIAVAPQSSGGALVQNFAQGATLNYTLPSAPNAFTEGIRVRCVLTVTPATGAGATYALNAGAPLNLIDNITVLYNGVQHKIRPYILKAFSQMSNYLGYPMPFVPIAGQNVAGNASYRNSGTPLTVNAANAWTFEIYLPFNALHVQDARGLLPTMGGETTAQVSITCAPQVMGPDPVMNTIAATGGAGNAVAVTGQVYVYSVYRDGDTLAGPGKLGLDLRGLGTTQFQQGNQLNILGANNVYRGRINIMEEIHWLVATVIDGNQSNKFCANSNISVLELSKDGIGANTFWRYGNGTNISVQEYLALEVPFLIGQDIDEGLIPFVMGPIWAEENAGNREGTQYLNTSLTGWTDANIGIQLNSVGAVAGISPRVEFHVLYVNQAGLIGLG